MSDRDCTKNAGVIPASSIPEDVYIAGAIVVTMAEDGRTYGTHFIPVSLDELPDPEVQEILASTITTAWALANNPGLTPQSSLEGDPTNGW